MKKQEAEFKFGSWTTPKIPLTIEYPLEVLDDIRATVVDGLQQLSHGGLEVGGVLFGARRDGTIRILTWRPISCEHAQGPSLRLSPRDRAELTRLLEVAKNDPDLDGLQPIGWFLSHTRSDIYLTVADQEIYRDFFPEPWQVTLVLRPTRAGTARAGFFARESDGSLKGDSSYQDFPVEPLTGVPPPEERPAPPRRDHPSPRERAEPRVAPRAVQEPPAPVQPPVLPVEEPHPTKARTRWLWAIPVCLALLIAGVVLKEKYLAPGNATFSFRAYNAGETVVIEWDREAKVIRGARQAVLEIRDKNQTQQYKLAPEVLHLGKMSYLRQGADVELLMTVYPPIGPAAKEFVRLVGSGRGAADHRVSGPAASPGEAEQLRNERDQLREQVNQLNEDLRKEKARADKAEELNRILQNRIDVELGRKQQGK